MPARGGGRETQPTQPPLSVATPVLTAAAARAPMRVLHVLDNLRVGGAETWLMALLKHWRAARFEARLLGFVDAALAARRAAA